MTEQQSGQVVRLADVRGRDDLEGHPGISAHSFVRPGAGCRWLHVTLNVIEEHGGIERHYHEGVDADHAYYVIEGEVLAWIGDQEYRVGPDSLMIFPCATVHGFQVVSPGGAKVLRLGAADNGITSGGSVFVSRGE
jgi:mannose-6-phosphate isomerase-like protein (cupin superfamily)